MATIEINGDDAVLKLSRMEDVEVMHVHSISAPLAGVQTVAGVDDSWTDLRGVTASRTSTPSIRLGPLSSSHVTRLLANTTVGLSAGTSTTCRQA